MTAPSGRHETKRQMCDCSYHADHRKCAPSDVRCSCMDYLEAPSAAPPPVEGETYAARVYAENLAKMPGRTPAVEDETEQIEVWHDFDAGPPDRSEWERVGRTEPTPPVVGDQPEETDTVNDESERVMRDLVRSFADQLDEDDADGPGNLVAFGLRHQADAFAAYAAAFYREATRPAVGERPTWAFSNDGGETWTHGVSGSLPVGAEVRVEWGVRYGPKLVQAKPNEEQARGVVGYYAEHANEPVELARRTITTYADGSFLTSAWQPVTDEEAGADA